MMMFEIALAVLLFIGAGLVTATVWARKSNWVRAGALCLFLTMLPVMVSTSLLSLGHPAPWLSLKGLEAGSYLILQAQFVQDEAIYVWLNIKGDKPFSVSLPWNNELADRMYGLLNAVDEGGDTEVYLKIPKEFSWDKTMLTVHVPPQRREPPPKVTPVAPPTYQRRPTGGPGRPGRH